MPFGLCIIPLVSLLHVKGSLPRHKYVELDIVLHRKMIYKGSALAPRVLLKWKILPPKHDTCVCLSLRTSMFESGSIVTESLRNVPSLYCISFMYCTVSISQLVSDR